MTLHTETPPPWDTVTDLLRTSLERFAERPALVWRDRRWTYARLEALLAAARRLVTSPGCPGDAGLMIVADNHPAYVIAYGAAQSLGRCTVEIGRHESIATLLSIAERTAPGFVLTDREDLKAALDGRIPAMLPDELLEAAESAGPVAEPAPNGAPAASATASIIYTSGTTGLPKGVVLGHGAFCFIAAKVAAFLELRPEDRYGLLVPLSHSYGKSNLLTTFATGGALVFMDDFQDLGGFLRRAEAERLTIFSAVPYHAHILLKRAILAAHDLSSLRAITFSGNRLPPETIDRLGEALPHVRLYSMYGLTESCTRACYVPPDRLADKKESCGRPLPGVEIRIRSGVGEAVPAGVSGEVLLRGPNIMQGYYGDPELTTRTLVDGWLRTGDVGRLDEDGYLYLEGREKDIIKCAGERISPAEIEEVLGRHPGVAEVAVVGSPDPVLGEVIHGFIVPRGGGVDERELRTYCASRLSHHKLPRRYTFIEALPRTATGKIRKHLLTES